MKVQPILEPIVCDIAGCKNLANYQYKNSDNTTARDSLKLCKDCCKNLFVTLSEVKEVNWRGKNKC